MIDTFQENINIFHRTYSGLRFEFIANRFLTTFNFVLINVLLTACVFFIYWITIIKKNYKVLLIDIDIVPKNIEYRIEFKKYNIDHHSVAQVKNLSQK